MTMAQREALVEALVATVLGRTEDFDAVELAEALDESGATDVAYRDGLREHYLKIIITD